MTSESLEKTLRRVLVALVAVFFITVILVTLVELLRFPAGACAIDGQSAACVRQRIVIILPWIGMGLMGWLLFLRNRSKAEVEQTLIAERDGGIPLARLVVIFGPQPLLGKSIPLYRNVTSIGRDPEQAEVTLYGPRDRSSIGALHCTIRYDRGQFTVIDHHSANGTLVNGRKLTPEAPEVLRGGDEIVIGDAVRLGAVLRFESRVPTVSVLPTPVRAAEPAPTPDSERNTSMIPTPGRRLISPDIFSKMPANPLIEPLTPDTSQRVAMGKKLIKAEDGPRGRDLPGDKFMLDPDDEHTWGADRQSADDSWMKDLS